jgi:hypothetical protein
MKREHKNDWKTRRTYGIVPITLSLLVFTLGGALGHAANSPETPRSPILVELFTSEGCSSCPPADAWLQQIDASQPVPGAQLIVLSEHVDYWNHDGWKDPYSSALLTTRQHSYVSALGLSGTYTPQIILDGTTELPPGQPQQVLADFQKAMKTPKLSVRLVDTSLHAGEPSTLQGHVTVDGEAQKHSGDIYVVTALDHADSQVLRGENGGRHLTHVAVVEDITKIGRLDKNRNFDGDFQVKLRPGTDPANLRVVVLVQESGAGKVLGETMEKGIH